MPMKIVASESASLFLHEVHPGIAIESNGCEPSSGLFSRKVHVANITRFRIDDLKPEAYKTIRYVRRDEQSTIGATARFDHCPG